MSILILKLFLKMNFYQFISFFFFLNVGPICLFLYVGFSKSAREQYLTFSLKLCHHVDSVQTQSNKINQSLSVVLKPVRTLRLRLCPWC